MPTFWRNDTVKKRLIAIMFALLAMLLLAACGQAPAAKPSAAPSETSELSATPAPTAKPTPSPSPSPSATPHVHVPVVDEAVEATCQHTGLTEGSHCSVCGEVLTAQTETPIQGHYYLNGYCVWCGMPAPGDSASGDSSSSSEGFELPWIQVF